MRTPDRTLRNVGLVLGVVAGTAAGARAQITTEPVASSETRSVAAGWGEGSSWADQHAQILALAGTRPIEVVLLGDSITQGFGDPGRRLPFTPGAAAFERWLAPLHAANLGISGDRVEHLLWRVDHGELTALAPQVVVVAIGTNNLTLGHAPGDVVAGTRALLQRLRTALPDAQLLTLGVFPRGERPDDPLRVAAADVTRGVAALADGRHITHLDLAAALLQSDGRADPAKFAGDFLHLQAAGYAAWTEAMDAPLRARLAIARATAAARRAPTPAQTRWQELEAGVVLRPPGDGPWPATSDPEAWVRAVRAAGLRLVLVDVRRSDAEPVAARVAAACAATGLAFGLCGAQPIDAAACDALVAQVRARPGLAELWLEGATPLAPEFTARLHEIQPDLLVGGDGGDVGRVNLTDAATAEPAGETPTPAPWWPRQCVVPRSADGRLAPLATLLDGWYAGAGSGALALFDLEPSASGRLDERDALTLRALAVLRRATFGLDFARAAKATASSATANSAPDHATDGNLASAWRAAADDATPELVVELGSPRTFDRISLREDPADGQRVAAFAVDGWLDGAFREVAHGTTIGRRRILRVAPLTTTRLRVRILAAWLPPALTDVGLFREPPYLVPPNITRGADGRVSITATPGVELLYRIDPAGTVADVDEQALRYRGPFDLEQGGVVTALAIIPPDSEVIDAENDGRHTGRRQSRAEFEARRDP